MSASPRRAARGCAADGGYANPRPAGLDTAGESKLNKRRIGSGSAGTTLPPPRRIDLDISIPLTAPPALFGAKVGFGDSFGHLCSQLGWSRKAVTEEFSKKKERCHLATTVTHSVSHTV